MQKKPKAEKDTSERYLLTYADMMNLLLILFIVLYSMSKVDAQKAQAVAKSLREGFNNQGVGSFVMANSAKGDTSSAVSKAVNQSIEDMEYMSLYREIMSLINKNGLANKVVVQIDKNGVVISLSENVLFERGSADLSGSSSNLVVSIGNLLKKVDFSQIIIEGHTDSDPIITSKYKDNLDLSTDRANNVNRLMVLKCGIAADKISSMGYGDTRPLVPNTTTENKAKNRRVVITILKPRLSNDAVLPANSIPSVSGILAGK